MKAALEAGFEVIPVPGASAPIAALTVSGLPTDAFLYLGYLPHKTSERHKRLQEAAEQPYTLIFLESPYRILEALEDILTVLGERQILVAREMTKMFEEYWRGSVSGALDHFKSEPARGEFTIVLEGKKQGSGKWTEQELLAAIQREGKDGKSASQLAGELADRSGWKKKEVYQRIVTLS